MTQASRIYFSGGGPYQDGEHLAAELKTWLKGRGEVTVIGGSIDGWDLLLTYPGAPIPEAFLTALIHFLGDSPEVPSQGQGRMDYVDQHGQSKSHYF